ncbi:MAG: cytochrome C peroxidase [Prosthecobacter sp.]|uniref:MbnP family protein n=1 Tax=Prosthecobacter sp. TaxID=1965333 RepID=UPI0019DFE605|nr:MbnP family protein [Prosthecobacter sp.]MBE2287819.1 cytochrome C peroxidase [Prosthecobacter sp.]
MPALRHLVFLLLSLPAQAVTLHGVIRHEAEKQPLLLDSLRYRTNAAETYSITRASWLMSGFALQRADGTWMEGPGHVAWMDALKKRTQFALPDVPAGRYSALRFHVGLDSTTNAANPAQYAPDHPLNPNVNGLHWSWQGGYIFLALEGSWRGADGKPGGFSYHLARDANRTPVVVKGDFDLRGDATAEINFDVATLIQGVKPLSFAKDGVSTHSQPKDPIAAALVANLPAAFALSSMTSHVPDIARPSDIRPIDLPAKHTPFRFQMSRSFPVPALPRDNPLLVERVALGEKLFNDPALSRDGTLSCATCHPASSAFSDPRRFSLGVEGRTGTRQGMPLFNLAWKKEFFWDGRAPSLRAQALMPIQDHLEMDETLPHVVAKLQKSHAADFERAFGTAQVTPERIGLALENFLLTLTSHDSKFDRVMRGEGKLSAEEQRGFELFMMEREPRMGSLGADCFHCHGGALFTDHQFRNNGLAIDATDLGRFKVTQSALDRGTFATPSLRNIALTAPYMHDGRFQTLEQVLDHYSEGVQRTDTLDPNLAKHPDGGLHLSAEEKKAVIAFLKTLTDRKFEAADSQGR